MIIIRFLKACWRLLIALFHGVMGTASNDPEKYMQHDNIVRLNKICQADISRYVKYYSKYGYGSEVGRIKGFNKAWIYVVYQCDDNWENYQDYTGIATSASYLSFISNDEALRRLS